MVDASGHFVKGSGRSLKANNPAVIGKISAAKRSRAYTEALQAFVPVDREGTPEAITSLEELMTAAARVATGKSVGVTCPNCQTEFGASIGVDSKVLTWLLERVLGRATETQNINVRSEQLVQMLTDYTPSGAREVVAVTPAERAERARQARIIDQ